MKNIKVVIGACFGDEGKGLMTDYFASKAENGIVVRFNGGAQAGHTVTTPEGKRHVFGHFGSGTLAGLPTYLSSFFVVNPLLFQREFGQLAALVGAKPKIYIDRYCLVTTPYDMMINQIVEMARGDARHGSCGVGFNETIVRSEREDLRITVQDLLGTHELTEKLNIIRKEYVFNRLKALGVTDIPQDFQKYFASEGILLGYLQDVKSMLEEATTCVTPVILNQFDSVIFEGAQGLMLDQSHEYFPHVTRSNTGMKNVREILFEADLEKEPIEITYATRAYLTRHGAGPFPTELPEKPYEGIEDKTNVTNAFQGSLRFGNLDIDVLGKTIHKDLKIGENYSLAISCLDQVGDEVTYIFKGNEKKSHIEGFIMDLQNAVFATDKIYTSYGPTRDTIIASVICTPR